MLEREVFRKYPNYRDEIMDDYGNILSSTL